MNKNQLGPGSNRDEIEDIILWELPKSVGKGNASLKDILQRYNIELEDYEAPVKKLGAEGLIQYKRDGANFLLQPTRKGIDYVELTLSIYTSDDAIDIEDFKRIIMSKYDLENFNIEDIENKEGYLITFVPQGNISENYFRFKRNRFLFYSIHSIPKTEPQSRFEYENLLDTFQKWTHLISNAENSQSHTQEQSVREEISFKLDKKRKIQQTKLQSDTKAKEDFLNRMPFVKALTDYIERLWRKQTDESYTINISGEWGSGKSSILHFLESELVDKKWIVIKFNAWEYQHLTFPWWIFLSDVFRQIRERLSGFEKFWFSLTHYWWKIVAVNKQDLLSVVLFFSVVTIIFLFKLIPKEFKELATIISIAGVAWLLFTNIASKILPGHKEASDNFQKNITDPIYLLKRRFEKIVSFPNSKIVIFIEDIDRCTSQNTVKFLEGIQTIFKSTKILYVFSGDKRWIRQCFEIEYNDFTRIAIKPGQSLGNLFTEKMFQMTIEVPVPTQSVVKRFISKTLTEHSKGRTNFKEEIKMEYLNAKTEEEISQLLSKYKDTDSEQQSIEAAVNRISSDDTQTEIEHELEAYFEILPTNPRSIKRFINDYSLMRQSLILKGVGYEDVDKDALVRWLVLKSKYPMLVDQLVTNSQLLNKGINGFDEVTSTIEYQSLVNGYITPQVVDRIIG